jgi:indole-3-glycerol phosphate synthase
MSDILKSITAYKLEEIAAAKAARSLPAVETAARAAPPVRPFAGALEALIRAGGFALIAEIKKASPSKGLIREDFEPSALAEAYAAGGAACLSVLTDGPSFRGAPEYLVAARAAAGLPALRKDFMLDPYQVPQSRALGADCILIIMAAVDDATAGALCAAAKAWGMDALAEVHDEAELERSLMLDCRLVGINNRDLRTFRTDLAVTREVAAEIPSGVLTVSESGISSPADVEEVRQAGARAILVGEHFMRHEDVGKAVIQLVGEREGASPQVRS